MATLPPVSQIAWLVNDIDAAMAYWAKQMHVGPWFVSRHIAWQSLSYEGEPCRVDISAAFAWNHAIQLELIQNHSNVPSVFTDYANTAGGIHHVGIRTADIAATERDLVASGLRVVQRGVNAGGVPLVYLHGKDTGVIELIGVLPGSTFFDTVKQAAIDWDGQTVIAS